MSWADKVEEDLVRVMHGEGDTATIGVVFGEVNGWVAIDVWVEEGFHG